MAQGQVWGMSAWTDEQPVVPLTKFPGKTGQRGVTFPGVIPAVLAASGTSSTWCWCSGCHTAQPVRRTAVSPPTAQAGYEPALL